MTYNAHRSWNFVARSWCVRVSLRPNKTDDGNIASFSLELSFDENSKALMPQLEVGFTLTPEQAKELLHQLSAQMSTALNVPV